MEFPNNRTKVPIKCRKNRKLFLFLLQVRYQVFGAAFQGIGLPFNDHCFPEGKGREGNKKMPSRFMRKIIRDNQLSGGHLSY